MPENGWDDVTHIGKSRGGGGGGGLRPTVVKSKAALNAAKLKGGVTTEKKYTGPNSVSLMSLASGLGVARAWYTDPFRNQTLKPSVKARLPTMTTLSRRPA